MSGQPSSVTRPRAVVFDLDGLMFNTEELYQHVGTEILRRRGREFPPKLLDAMMGRPGRIALQIMIDWHRLEDTVERLAAESDALFDEILAERLEPMPGLIELLDALEHVELPKAVATSSGRAFVDRVLGKFNLSERFHFILTAEDVVEGKPGPEIYLEAARRFGLAPSEVLVLEDSENGCLAAVRAGTFLVAVPAGHSLRHDFSTASMVIPSLKDPSLYKVLRLR